MKKRSKKTLQRYLWQNHDRCTSQQKCGCLLYYYPQQMLMKNNFSLQFFPTSTEGTDWSVNAQSLDLNEKHVAAVGYKMALRNHNESSFHNKTESCVYFLPYTGMVFGNVLWCFTVYARGRLTHTNLWPLCSMSSHLHWFLSNLCQQPIIHLTSTNLEYWNYTHSYPENTHYPLKDMRGKYGLQSNKITCINTYIERHSIYQL